MLPSSSSKNKDGSTLERLVFGLLNRKELRVFFSSFSDSSSYLFSLSSSDELESSSESYDQFVSSSEYSSSSSFGSSALKFSSFFTSYFNSPFSVLTKSKILLFVSLSLNLSYHPFEKLKSYLPGISSSSIIDLACLSMYFLRSLGLFMMKLASLISISGQRAFRPPSFFLISFAWYHLLIFLG